MPTKDLYMLQGTSTVLLAGTQVQYAEATSNDDIEISFRKDGSAAAEVKALLSSGATAFWCIGQDDGTAAPTAAAGKFVLPITRTYIDFPARVVDIVEYLTETGPRLRILLDRWVVV